MAVEDPRNGSRDSPREVVPDDARELERDVAALARERRALRRQQRFTELLRRRRGLSALLVGGVLAVVAVFGALLVVLRPSFPERAPARPLASPTVPAGQVGGLLPDGPVLTPGRRTTVRELARPAVLVLVPIPCGCDEAVSSVVDQALQVTRTVRLLSTGRQDPTGVRVAALRTGPARGLALSGVDEQGVLATSFGSTGLTVLLVGGDGVVVDAVRDVRAGQRLDAALGRLQASR